ncbi:YfhO family protein [Gemmiger formicilis]|nr:YfhO family protein [Gemmiger formicilis]
MARLCTLLFHGGAAVCAPLYRGCRRGRRVLPLRGDFNDQQINFYQYANAFVKNGGSFSWATDLGSGFVNSYSFYLLGSPFFWLSMVVPARLMPWAMVPLLCLKMAVAGGGGYLWARRWVRDETWSMLAGCLYAFSGFSIYNIFSTTFWTWWRCFRTCWPRWTTRSSTIKGRVPVLGRAEPCR